MKKEHKIILFLFLLALIIRILFFFAVPIVLWDEAVYANLGYAISQNPLDYSFQNWSDLVLDNSWPRAGFRPPLLPYLLSIFYFLKLDVLIGFLMPIVGALTVILVYFLGKKLFNKKIGLISAIFLTLVPTHAYLSSRILNDPLVAFFTTLSFFLFWKGFEENSNKSKIWFGVSMALALLSKYTCLWIFPIFLIYFLIRDRSFKFTKDKYFWFSVLAFFVTLTPWFIYGFFTYGNPIGAFLHGFQSAFFWGGVQPWFFFFSKGLVMLLLLAIIFPLAIIYIFYKRHFAKKEVYLLLVWVFFFGIIGMLMPHKEDRFILPLVPAICLLCGFFISQIKLKKKFITILVILMAVPVLIAPAITYNYMHQLDKDDSFSKSIELIKNSNVDIIITESPPTVYYYSKKPAAFFPDNINSSILSEGVPGKKTIFLFVNFAYTTNNPFVDEMRKELETNQVTILSGDAFSLYGIKNSGINISLNNSVESS